MEMKPNQRWTRAWIWLCLSLAVHVADEALTDFLGWWNPTIRGLREQWPYLPFPTFSFGVWLTLLILAVVVLLLLTPQVSRGAWWMRPVSYAFGIVMLINGLGHVAVSFYLGRPAPGVYSAPLLLVVSSYMLGILKSRVPNQ